MNFVMLRELMECFEELHNYKDVHVLVIKGSGKLFCAGGDVKMMQTSGDVSDFDSVMPEVTRLAKAYYTLPMITISQIHGAAAGYGFGLALGSDIVVAEQSAKLALNFTKIGLIPDGGSHFFLQERVGNVKALHIISNAEQMTANEAFKIGLIDQVVNTNTGEKYVEQLVDEMLQSSIVAKIHSKMILHRSKSPILASILDDEEIAQKKLRRTTDHIEGLKAFLEKRTPQFNGQ